jgi:hypothetical protein
MEVSLERKTPAYAERERWDDLERRGGWEVGMELWAWRVLGAESGQECGLAM